MKVNQWTLGLAAAGVISFGAVAQAEEKPSNQVLTAVSGTQISGYVSTSVHWNPGTTAGFGAGTGSGSSYLAGKGDGFNLDVIQLTISKPLDEGEWSAGYVAEIWMGPDATVLGNALGTTGNGSISLAQGYLALNVPVGNGITVKVGTFNTIIGYESNNSPDNPNYSRSYAYTFGPFQHEGIVASYKLCDAASITAGIANSQNTGLGLRGGVQSEKTYMAAVSLTAPDSWGFLKGAVLNAGIVDGSSTVVAGGATSSDVSNIHVSATIPTPWETIKTGAALDILRREGLADTTSIAGYVSFHNTGIEKLKLHTRVEYFDNGGGVVAVGAAPGIAARGAAHLAGAGAAEILATTITADYQLWANVISRLEYRWDHDCSGGSNLTGALGNNNAHLLALNLVYKF